MQLFYLESLEEKIKLNTAESRHITKVLRKKEGDVLSFTDGKGFLYKAKIIDLNNKNCIVKVINRNQNKKQHNYYLHIAIAPTKNLDRFEWFLEKSTEIGIDEITPVICNNSERKVIKTQRSKRILLSAMKQSLKYHLPKINESISLNEFLKKDIDGAKYIAHCKKINRNQLEKERKKKKTLILIGPEGDFTNEEINLALQNNFKSISLGKSRLRTETAGIIATHIINIK